MPPEFFALGHLDNPTAVPFIVMYEAHADAEVRYGVACALGCYSNDPEAIKTVAKLTADQDEDVRDRATFGFGVLGDADTDEIREVLAARLSDTNEDVREQAVVALAKRP